MSIRPRFQRAFVDWLEESRPRLALQPRMVLRSDACLNLQFDHTTPHVEIKLSRSEEKWRPYDYRLWVWNCRGSSYIYPFLMLSTEAQRVGKGYRDTSNCDAEDGAVYPSREALWRDNLFEPFLKWVNEELSQAIGIAEGSSLVEWVPLSPGDEMESQRPVSEPRWLMSSSLVQEGEQLETDDFKPDYVVLLRRDGLAVRRRHPRS